MATVLSLGTAVLWWLGGLWGVFSVCMLACAHAVCFVCV